MENMPHKICWEQRRLGTITGVKDVISFDETLVQVETVMGVLTVAGSQLQVKRLSVEQGEMELEGNIEKLSYSESKQEKGKRLLGRLFQ